MDEQYWHNKHPLKFQLYEGRPLPSSKITGEATKKNYLMDIRRFVWGDDILMKSILKDQNLIKRDIDDTALAIQKWVVSAMTYVGDVDSLSSPEFWLFPAETFNMAVGDCEDGALLMGSLLINALPEEHKWRVRCVAGLVQANPAAPTGGHMWVEYFRETDNQPVILDWCYLEDSGRKVKDKPKRSDVGYIVDTWFSTNDKFTWAHKNLGLSGRLAEQG